MPQDSKIKVVALCHSPNIGGAELALQSLIQSTKERVEWHLVVLGHGPVEPKIVSGASAVHRIDLPWWCHEAHDIPPKLNVRSAQKQLKKLKQISQDADILLTNTITVPWLGFIATRLSIPHIWYVHEFGNIDHNLTFLLGYRRTLEYISKLSSRVLTISTSVSGHLQQVIPEPQIDIIHQSINISELLKLELPSTSEPYSLLCLGALKPSKGQHIAAEAVAGIPKGSGYSLDIRGPVADPNYLDSLARDSSVSIKPGRYDPVAEIPGHQALIIASNNEALGRVTLEGLASGRVVIGYDCPATRELLADNRGVLYSPNTPEALRDVLLKELPKFLMSYSPETNRTYVANTFSASQESQDFLHSYDNARKQKTLREDLLSEYLEYLKSQTLTESLMHQKAKFFYIRLLKLVPPKIKSLLKKLLK